MIRPRTLATHRAARRLLLVIILCMCFSLLKTAALESDGDQLAVDDPVSEQEQRKEDPFIHSVSDADAPAEDGIECRDEDDTIDHQEPPVAQESTVSPAAFVASSSVDHVASLADTGAPNAPSANAGSAFGLNSEAPYLQQQEQLMRAVQKEDERVLTHEAKMGQDDVPRRRNHVVNASEAAGVGRDHAADAAAAVRVEGTLVDATDGTEEYDDRTLLDVFGEVAKEYLTQKVVS